MKGQNWARAPIAAAEAVILGRLDEFLAPADQWPSPRQRLYYETRRLLWLEARAQQETAAAVCLGFRYE